MADPKTLEDVRSWLRSPAPQAAPSQAPGVAQEPRDQTLSDVRSWLHPQGQMGAPATITGPRKAPSFGMEAVQPTQTEGGETSLSVGDAQIEDLTDEQKRLALEMGASILLPQLGAARIAAMGAGPVMRIGLRAMLAGTGEAGVHWGTMSWDPEFKGDYLSADTLLGEVAPRFGAGAAGEILAPVLGAGFSKVGRGAVKVAERIPGLRRAVRPFSEKLLEPGAERTLEMIEQARGPAGARVGGAEGREIASTSPSGGQIMKNQFHDILENVLEASVVGGQRVFRRREVNQKLVQEMAEDFGRSFGGTATKELAGETAQDCIEGGVMAFSETGRQLYKALDEEVAKEALPIATEVDRMMRLSRGNLLRGVSEEERANLTRWAIQEQDRLAEEAVLEFGEGAREAAMRNAIDGVPQLSRSYRNEAGELIADPSRVQQYVKDVLVRREALGKGAVEHTRTSAIARQISADEEAGVVVSPDLAGIAKKILEAPDYIRFERAQLWRSQLLAIERGSVKDLSANRSMGRFKQLASAIDQDITEATSRISGGEAERARRLADEFWRGGKEVYNDKFIQGLMTKDPDVAFDAAIRAKRPILIRKIRTIVMDQDPTGTKWAQIQGRWIEDMLSKARDPGTNILSGKKLQNLIDNFGGTDQQALKELFPAGEIRTFKELARAAEIVEARAGGNRIGSMLIQFGQAGAGIQFITAPFQSEQTREKLNPVAFAVILSPVAIGRIWSNPTMTRWLTVGLREIPGTMLAARASGQFLTNLQNMIASGLISPEDLKLEVEGAIEDWPEEAGALAKRFGGSFKEQYEKLRGRKHGGVVQ